MWQDIVISIISITASIALIPQVINGFKTKRKIISIFTSLITFIGLYILSFVYLTLKLNFSTIITMITGTLWLILFIQSIIYKNNLYLFSAKI